MRAKAQRHAILIHDESSCRVDRPEGSHLRIGFARHNEKEMAEGLSALLALGRTLPLWVIRYADDRSNNDKSPIKDGELSNLEGSYKPNDPLEVTFFSGAI